jgi:hypothetical protein
MKLLKIFLILPVFLFSYEIEFTKNFSHDLPHNVLSGNLSVQIEDETEKIVDERLTNFEDKIKSFNQVEKKRLFFNIKPQYKHLSTSPKISGYVGELKYKVSTYKAKMMDALISEISKMKKNRDTSVSLENLSWSVQEDAYSVTLDLLRSEAINWGITYSENLSNDLNTTCKLKKIQVNILSETENQVEKESLVIRSNTRLDKEFLNDDIVQERLVIIPKYVLECE